MKPRPDPLPAIARRVSRWEWATLAGVWLLLAYAAVDPTLESLRGQGVQVRREHVLAAFMVDWALWMPLLPPLFRALDRTPLARGRRTRNLCIRLAVLGLAAAVHAAVAFAVVGAMGHALGLRQELFRSPLMQPLTLFSGDVENSAVAVLAHAALQRIHRDRLRQQRAADLEASLARARLQALSAELQPHFLFNTMNGIVALIEDEPAAARTMLIHLCDLLRLSLESCRDSESDLRGELNRLALYVEIQQMRFGPRLSVNTDVDPTLLDARLPSMLLQPLVENALVHGIAARPGPGRVDIRVGREGDGLLLQVCDDGVGLPPGTPRERVGSMNTRARLSAFFPERHQMRIATRAEGGTVVEIRIPYEPVRAHSPSRRERAAGGTAAATR